MFREQTHQEPEAERASPQTQGSKNMLFRACWQGLSSRGITQSAHVCLKHHLYVFIELKAWSLTDWAFLAGIHIPRSILHRSSWFVLPRKPFLGLNFTQLRKEEEITHLGILLSLVDCFETVSCYRALVGLTAHCIAKANLEMVAIFLPLPPGC